MNYSKSLYRCIFAAVSLLLLLLIIFYNTASITKKDALTDKKITFSNINKEKISIINSSFDVYADKDKDKNDNLASSNEKFKGLEDFIKYSLESHKGLQAKSDNSMFSHLNEKILANDEWVSKESLADYSIRLKKLKKMQRLAVHISGNYKVPLVKAEKIVYISFVEAKKKNLEPTLVLSLIGVESTFNEFSKSHAGAVGLTQVMPNIHKAKIAKLADEDIWSVSSNIKVGTDILREYLNITNGNITLALQRYNGSLNDESLNYSNKVFNKMNSLNKI